MLNAQQTIRINGTIGDTHVDVTVTVNNVVSPKDTADFVVDTYEALLDRSPSFIEKVQEKLPTLFRALRALQKVAEKLNFEVMKEDTEGDTGKAKSRH